MSTALQNNPLRLSKGEALKRLNQCLKKGLTLIEILNHARKNQSPQTNINVSVFYPDVNKWNEKTTNDLKDIYADCAYFQHFENIIFNNKYLSLNKSKFEVGKRKRYNELLRANTPTEIYLLNEDTNEKRLATDEEKKSIKPHIRTYEEWLNGEWEYEIKNNMTRLLYDILDKKNEYLKWRIAYLEEFGDYPELLHIEFPSLRFRNRIIDAIPVNREYPGETFVLKRELDAETYLRLAIEKRLLNKNHLEVHRSLLREPIFDELTIYRLPFKRVLYKKFRKSIIEAKQGFRSFVLETFNLDIISLITEWAYNIPEYVIPELPNITADILKSKNDAHNHQCEQMENFFQDTLYYIKKTPVILLDYFREQKQKAERPDFQTGIYIPPDPKLENLNLFITQFVDCLDASIWVEIREEERNKRKEELSKSGDCTSELIIEETIDQYFLKMGKSRFRRNDEFPLTKKRYNEIRRHIKENIIDLYSYINAEMPEYNGLFEQIQSLAPQLLDKPSTVIHHLYPTDGVCDKKAKENLELCVDHYISGIEKISRQYAKKNNGVESSLTAKQPPLSDEPEKREPNKKKEFKPKEKSDEVCSYNVENGANSKRREIPKKALDNLKPVGLPEGFDSNKLKIIISPESAKFVYTGNYSEGEEEVIEIRHIGEVLFEKVKGKGAKAEWTKVVIPLALNNNQIKYIKSDNKLAMLVHNTNLRLNKILKTNHELIYAVEKRGVYISGKLFKASEELASLRSSQNR